MEHLSQIGWHYKYKSRPPMNGRPSISFRGIWRNLAGMRRKRAEARPEFHDLVF
jgi:hypothetical protein